eukprot:scaffold151653_cov76-Cyclotella_meneghiniana.AAC.1
MTTLNHYSYAMETMLFLWFLVWNDIWGGGRGLLRRKAIEFRGGNVGMRQSKKGKKIWKRLGTADCADCGREDGQHDSYPAAQLCTTTILPGVASGLIILDNLRPVGFSSHRRYQQKIRVRDMHGQTSLMEGSSSILAAMIRIIVTLRHRFHLIRPRWM